MNCLECGAPSKACEPRFHEFLAKEFTDPGYGAVHQLTVSAYMLQHSSKLTREGWLHERNLLREFLISNKPPAVVIEQNREFADSSKWKFKISSKSGMPLFDKALWTKTIMNVNADEVEVYRRDVIAWAKAVLEDANMIEI